MATYYWVGGTGTWDASSTSNWALTSGGLPGISAPTSADTVIFDSASGTGTCTTASGAVAKTVTFNTSTVTLTLGVSLTLGGAFTLTAGAINLNNNVLTSLTFSSATANVRSINFSTSGKIVLTGNNTTVWAGTTTDQTNISIIGTSRVELSYAGSTGTRTIRSGLITLQTDPISFYVIAGTDIVATTGFNILGTLDFTGFSGTFTNTVRTIYGDLVISSGMTLTAGANSTTLAATSGTQLITTNGNILDFPVVQNGVGGAVQLQDNLTLGSTRTYTFTAGTLDLTGNSGNWVLTVGNWSSVNSNTRAILFGAGSLDVANNGTAIFSMSTATGFTYTGTPTVNLTYSSSTGTRTVTFGSTGGTESNAINFNVNAGTDSVVFSARPKNINFTGFSGTLSASAITMYGNLTISTGMTLAATSSVLTFAATSGTQQITTSGKTIDFPLTFNGIGGTFAFQDSLTQAEARNFTVTNGTLKLKSGTTSTVGVFVTSGTTQKYLQSTLAGNQATLSQSSGDVTASYLSIQDINATGGANWVARTDLGCKDLGNNTGWNFIFIAIQQIFKPIIEKILKPIILN